MGISAINSNQFRTVPFLTPPPCARSYRLQHSLRCPRVIVKSTSVFGPLANCSEIQLIQLSQSFSNRSILRSCPPSQFRPCSFLLPRGALFLALPFTNLFHICVANSLPRAISILISCLLKMFKVPPWPINSAI